MKNRQHLKKTIKRVAGKLAGALLPLLALVLIIGAGATPVFAFPGAPHQFWGSVTINGNPAPAGLTVSAKIGGTTYATTTTDAQGRYGYASAFLVPGDDSTTPAIEGGKSGDTVEFYVNGTLVTTNAFQPGGMTAKNLAVTTPIGAPTMTNGTGASNITQTGARLNGSVTATGGENPVVHVYWGPTDGGTTAGNWANDVNLGALGAGDFFTNITGLNANTPYYYRTYGINSGGGAWAASTSQFTTLAAINAPTMTNGTGASSITQTGARLNGSVTTTGGENPVVHVFWGPTDGGTTAGNWANDVNLGALGAGDFFTDITGLNANTPYYYRTYGINSGGGAWAATSATFTTQAAGAGQKLIGADNLVGAFRNAGGHIFFDKWTAVATGNLETMKVKCFGQGNVKVAIYADNNGVPGTLINAVNASTPVGAGWNDIPFPSTLVTQGTVYWLASKSDNDNILCTAQTGSVQRYAYTPYANAFPVTPVVPNTFAGYNLVAGWSTIAPVAPGTPTLNTTVTLAWNAATGTVTKYQLQVNTAVGFNGTVVYDQELGNVTSQTVTVPVGTTCYWRVRAGNTGGWGAWSNVGNLTVN